MDGRPMLTIEESSVVMKVAVPERAKHDPLVRALRTIDGRRRGDVGVRLARRGLAAERGRDDEGDRGRA
jgi:hypothetical protein